MNSASSEDGLNSVERILKSDGVILDVGRSPLQTPDTSSTATIVAVLFPTVEILPKDGTVSPGSEYDTISPTLALELNWKELEVTVPAVDT